MPISGHHTTREIDCSKVCSDTKPLESSFETVRLNDVMAVPGLNMPSVCKNHDRLSHINFPELERKNFSITISIDNLD